MQTMLREEALKAGDVASYGTRDALAQIEADLKAAGMTVNEIDVTPFKEATAGVYEKLGYGDAARRVAGDRQRPVSFAMFLRHGCPAPAPMPVTGEGCSC